jgi:stage V sporulation protein B
MDKAMEMGRSSVAGSFHLLIGVVASTVIMAVGTLLLAGLLEVDELGLYGIAMIPAAMINYFRDLGVNTAMTQQIAGLRASGKESQIHDVIVSGVFFEVISGIFLSLVLFVTALPLALILSPGNATALSTYISIMSLSVFAGALTAAASGIFVGFERMKLNSVTQVFQSIVKTAIGPFLIVLGFGVLGAVYAAMGSIVAGGVVSILIVYYSFLRPLRKCKVAKCNIKRTLRPMLKYGLPLTMSTIVIGVLPQIFAFMMAIYAGEWMMGNYYAAIYFSVLLTFVSFPIATALFPVFSKLNPEKEPELMKIVFASSVKYTAALLVPATMLLITLGSPLVNTLFPKDGILEALFIINAEPKFPYAPLFLALSSIINLFVLVGNISLGTFQTGIGKTNQVMKQSLLSLAVGVPSAYLLVSYFHALGGPNAQLSASYAVIGGIIGTLVASAPSVGWGLYWIWKNYGVKADFISSAKIFASSVIASVITYLIIDSLIFPYWMILIAGFVVFSLVYIVTIPLLGAIDTADINNLKAMFSGLGLVSKLVAFPLLFMQKLCKENSVGIELQKP